MARDMPTSNNEKMKNVHPAKSFDNLLQNYQKTVYCLIQCESIIRTLQHKLTSKDKHIATLEQKLVQMSFELASSKALEDEHRLLKRNITSGSNHGSDNECPPSPQANEKQQETALQSLAVEINNAPIRAVRRNTCISSDARSAHTQSLTLHNRPVVSTSIPYPYDPSVPQEMNEHNHSNIGRRRSTVELNRPRQLLSQHSMPSPLDESVPSRKLFNIGQYLLGFSRNETAEVENAIQKVNEDQNYDDIPQRRLGQKGRNFQSSSGSLISTVVFPVSFNEVLVGCLGDDVSGGPCTNNEK